MGVEISTFDEDMSVVLFSKNFRPIGTRYLTSGNHAQYLPTILVESDGLPVELLIYWQTRVSVPPQYSVVRDCLTILNSRYLRLLEKSRRLVFTRWNAC